MLLERIEAITICIGYGDFLGETIVWNKNHFDRYIVVTSSEDLVTRGLCRRHNVDYLVTEDYKRDGMFSKGRLVERGLQHLSEASWILHLDADIVLPMNFRRSLEKAHLKKTCVYGFDRFMVEGYNEWTKLVLSGWINEPYPWPQTVAIPDGYKLGGRWIGQDGYVPIGFSQLWHRTGGGEEWGGVRMKPYPLEHGSACRSDVQFSLMWDRQERVLIPEIFVAHLSSGCESVGINWDGRKSPPFERASSTPVVLNSQVSNSNRVVDKQ